MLPLQQAYEVRASILEYLKATYSFKDKAVGQAFSRFVEDPDQGIFKGPYISVKLPFVTSDEQEIPLEIKPAFPPYDHQYKAFQRLSTQAGRKPASTLITTGTSSGKTESFLFPILDHCYAHRHRQGIKVIILYPMNALATDQAKRLAEAIWADERLRGKITAGLFIGEGKEKNKFPANMGKDHLIENRQNILDSPPDILLTNFKMLDYALMRSYYNNLWSFNREDPTLLQFLVLDELHTYDGAQGTDVANLLRRLKLKLDIPKGHICAVGTSATIGTGEDARLLLLEYAEKVFGEHFEPASLITEKRMSVEDFFETDEAPDPYLPLPIELTESRLIRQENYAGYIQRQRSLWLIDESADAGQLGVALRRLQIVRDLVKAGSGRMCSLSSLMRSLADLNPAFRRSPDRDADYSFSPREEIIYSLLALISEAKAGEKNRFPLLFVQVQLWVRELSGVLRSLSPTPSFGWKDSVAQPDMPKAMPAYYCRDCGASGWLGVKDDNKNSLSEDSQEVYAYFFSNHKNIYFINSAEHKHINEYEPTTTIDDYLNPHDLSLHAKEGPGMLKIHAVRKNHENRARHICPQCNTENTLGIIGSRVPTLSSITISQVLASDLDPRPERERKMLAFTNSVQDAAHQAGFIEARNYRFTFRASLQRVLNGLDRPVDLHTLQLEFLEFWKNRSDERRQHPEEAYYFRFFPADYKGKVDLSHDYRDRKQLTEAFKAEFDLRLQWELLSEYGYNALIGRTLEKTGSSAVRFDESKLEAVYARLQSWLEANQLSGISDLRLLPFANGVLHRMRVRGGIDHPYFRKFREGKLELRELNWWKDSRHFLNRNFGERTRLPKLLTDQPHSKGMLDTTYSASHGWYRNYFIKSFPQASHYAAIVNEFYSHFLDALVAEGILNRVENIHNRNYAIVPGAVIVENQVRRFACPACGAELQVAASDRLTGLTPCLNYTCEQGKYEPLPAEAPNYYQRVYNRKRSPRIYAAEHTGLLERRDRENKETDFKERPRFNSLNVIVATSTLEMGIDIGTLNTAINMAVPPLTANFIQRVGRAGRSSGSALIINFAQRKPHDLYYYQEPLDMMEGSIATPGCYLEARDILFRHFFAFCIDNWTSEDPVNNSIPGPLMMLRLLQTDLNQPSFFASRIINFVKTREDELLRRFCDFYRSDLDDTTVLDELQQFLKEGLLYARVRKIFEQLKQEYHYLLDKRQEIDSYIKTHKLAETDEMRQSLEQEKKALHGMKRLLDKRFLLEHLTNAGILPNYAFPETGVSLKGRVKHAQPKGSNSLPGDTYVELVRPATTAISELAPDNSFYALGYKFAISGLNTYDWKEAGTLQQKRFCSSCDHLEIALQEQTQTCPKCGDRAWSSVQNVHTFVKLNGVKSINQRNTATLDDKSEDRDSSIYRISRHFHFEPASFQGAWGMREIPFGIEYVRQVRVQTVNLGLASSVDANRITINGIEQVPRHGFITCKHCGKSTARHFQGRSGMEDHYHYGYCKYKNRLYQSMADDVFEEVFLFREMQTEAIKVLLPVQNVDGEAQVNMFKAGFELGLKKYYKGNPAHIGLADYLEYNPQNGRFDRYLVLYDSISGGTGYLGKLFEPEAFTQVLKLAYTAIRECNCQFQGKDGCYRCIYTYANQRLQDALSRSQAEKLFAGIIEKSGSWEAYNTGLGALSGNGQIEESELEERFIRSLRNHCRDKASEGWRFEEILQEGIQHYRMHVINEQAAYSYVIRPQYPLGIAEQVAQPSRADFYITLSQQHGEEVSQGSADLVGQWRDIAVYLDGYTYHASAERQRFVQDVRKRQAIVASGDKISWTLTWDDLERFDAVDPASRRDTVAFHPAYQKALQTVSRLPYWNLRSEDFVAHTSNSMDRLLWLLANPAATVESSPWIPHALISLQPQFGIPSVYADQIHQYLERGKALPDTRVSDLQSGEWYVFPNIQLDHTDLLQYRTAIKIKNGSLISRAFIGQIRDALDKQVWEHFWQVYNLTQSATEVIFDEDHLQHSNQAVEDRYACLQYHDPALHPLVRRLIDLEIPFAQEGGFFIEDGNTFAEAMLGFEEARIVISPLSERDRQIFLQAGYREEDPNNFDPQILKK